MSAERPWEKGLYFGPIKIVAGGTGGRVTVAREGEIREGQPITMGPDYTFTDEQGKMNQVTVTVTGHDKNALGFIRHGNMWSDPMPHDREKFNLEPGSSDFSLPGNRFLRHEP